MMMYDDHWCKIEIVPANFPGCYHVILDDDPESAQACVHLYEAKEVAEEMREAFLEEHGQFGVGS